MNTSNTTLEVNIIKNQYQNQPISISGPSAVGKSTTSRMLSEKLNIPFFDLDDEVCKAAGYNTTKEVIRTLGHDEFKIIQNKCLRNLTQRQDRIVFASGGEIVRPGYDQKIISDNRSLISKYAYNICLFPSTDIDESTDILFARLHDGKRDTQTTGESWEQFRSYIDVFDQYATLANVVLLTHNASLDDICNKILQILSQE